MFCVQKDTLTNIKEYQIKNLDKLVLKIMNSFLIRTKLNKTKILSNGGRVLNFATKSGSFKECQSEAIQLKN